MAISGKADPTLVGAATKAALAAVPGDLSGVHQRIARAHTAMAQTTGAVWGKALEVIGTVGGKLIENAKQVDPTDSQWNQNQSKFLESLKEARARGIDPSNETGMVKVRNPKTGEFESVPAENRFTHFDNNGNQNLITIQTTEEKIDSLRKELSSVRKLDLDRKGKKKERARIRRVMDNVRQENVDFAAFAQTMTTQLGQDLINQKASGIYNLPGMLFSQAMLAKGESVKQTDPDLAMYDGARAIQGYDDDGRMVFTYVNKDGIPFKDKEGNNMTIGKGDLNTLFVPNSPQQGVMDALIDPKAIKNNWRRGIENFEHEVNRSIDASIKDKNTFLDIAYYNSTNSNGSLADNLNAIEISEGGVAEAKETEMFGMFIGAIEGINGKDKLDVTGDGKFNEEDYATQENYAALVKKALSGENLQLGKNLLKMHFNNQVLRHFNKEVEINTPTQEETTDYKRRKAYFEAESARFKALKLQNELNNKVDGGISGNFDHVNKGGFIDLAGVSVQKGSLENIRTDIENKKSFYLGPKDDKKAFVPVGKSKWEMRDLDGEVLATYNGVSQLIKSGLKTSDKGFRSLITIDINSDDVADGPASLDFLNKKYYDLIDRK